MDDTDRSPFPDSRERRFGFLSWEFRGTATEAERHRQQQYQQEVAARQDASFGADCYVDETAAVFCDHLRLGDRSYLAAGTYVTGDITLGDDCTLNPYAVLRGRVTAGAGVRIGAHANVLGFNHGIEPEAPVFRQPTTSRGIVLGDDVWVGSSASILDGVRIGDHAVVGAGAVVTKDVPAWAVVGGSPARVIRDRRGGPVGTANTAAAPADPGPALASFAQRARAQVQDVLGRCYDGARYLDSPGAKPTVRAWCDAVEIADLLLHRAPDQHSPDDLIARFQRYQDPGTGLTPEADLADGGAPVPGDLSLFAGPAPYHLLCVGYALHLLGSAFRHPITALTDLGGQDLDSRLDALPWGSRAWSAGSVLDHLGTALFHNVRDFADPRGASALFGWLTTRVDRVTGVWGRADPENGRWQVVNGFYRLTRGTFAQFGVPLPERERAVDTVLAHAADRRWFTGAEYTACNVLDVVHPLWLAGRHTGHRADEARVWAAEQIPRILAMWVDGQGFAFQPEGPRSAPGLQGTEMWLAVLWLAADLIGCSDALGYRPRGVHRPEPAADVSDLIAR